MLAEQLPAHVVVFHLGRTALRRCLRLLGVEDVDGRRKRGCLE